MTGFIIIYLTILVSQIYLYITEHFGHIGLIVFKTKMGNWNKNFNTLQQKPIKNKRLTFLIKSSTLLCLQHDVYNMTHKMIFIDLYHIINIGQCHDGEGIMFKSVASTTTTSLRVTLEALWAIHQWLTVSYHIDDYSISAVH